VPGSALVAMAFAEPRAVTTDGRFSLLGRRTHRIDLEQIGAAFFRRNVRGASLDILRPDDLAQRRWVLPKDPEVSGDLSTSPLASKARLLLANIDLFVQRILKGFLEIELH
jgi:hypothetical protein